LEHNLPLPFEVIVNVLPELTVTFPELTSKTLLEPLLGEIPIVLEFSISPLSTVSTPLKVTAPALIDPTDIFPALSIVPELPANEPLLLY
jgi:hypothetical protein